MSYVNCISEESIFVRQLKREIPDFSRISILQKIIYAETLSEHKRWKMSLHNVDFSIWVVRECV